MCLISHDCNSIYIKYNGNFWAFCTRTDTERTKLRGKYETSGFSEFSPTTRVEEEFDYLLSMSRVFR